MKAILIFVNAKRKRSRDLADRIKAWSRRERIGAQVITYRSTHLQKEAESVSAQIDHLLHPELIAVIGGDGSLLRAARTFISSDLPFLTIASGQMNFLMRIPANDCIRALKELQKLSKIPYERHLMLQGQVADHNDRIYALNEIVIASPDRKRLAKLMIEVGGQEINKYQGDGVIISTPLGSTAYNLSADGPIVGPHTPALVINPLCSHRLSARPLVLPASSQIIIRSLQRSHLSVISDGQEERELHQGEYIRIKKAKQYLKLITTSFDTDYFANLQTKLHWN